MDSIDVITTSVIKNCKPCWFHSHIIPVSNAESFWSRLRSFTLILRVYYKPDSTQSTSIFSSMKEPEHDPIIGIACIDLFTIATGKNFYLF